MAIATASVNLKPFAPTKAGILPRGLISVGVLPPVVSTISRSSPLALAATTAGMERPWPWRKNALVM